MSMTTEEAFSKLIKAAIIQKLQQNATLIHTNKDAYYSPSRWWFDTADPSQGGKILNTSGSMSATDNGNLNVTVNLDYTLTER